VATKVVMPKLSDTMSEGTINEWLKKEGDRVEAGEALATVETDKATMELESYSSGVLRKVLVPAGGVAPVGNLIAVIAEANEDIGGVLAEAGGAKAAAPAEAAPAPQASVPAGRLTVRSAKLRWRTLTLSLAGAQSGTVRASVKRGSRFVAKAAARPVASTVRLRLNRRLGRGTYTVKVISQTGTVGTVRLRVRR
jgi:pyruvate dehydrogenase E2 component (dihydrolipoamide acetyltransferase)